MSDGLCECGCGNQTSIAKKTNRKWGHVQGYPVRFLVGHYSKLHQTKMFEERFWEQVNKNENGCWLWTGFLDKQGYGRIGIKKTRLLAHRASYEMHKEKIPSGLQIDHLCRVRHCVNPDHLEVVTAKVNINRGMSPHMVLSRSGFCKRGHEVNAETHVVNKNGWRRCLICARIRAKERRKAQRATGRR